MSNKMIVRIESGNVYLEATEGDWCQEEWQQDYLHCLDGDYYDPLLEEEGIQEAIDSGRVYLVTIHNPYFEINEGCWNLDWGFVNSEAYICWDKPIEIEELKE